MFVWIVLLFAYFYWSAICPESLSTKYAMQLLCVKCYTCMYTCIITFGTRFPVYSTTWVSSIEANCSCTCTRSRQLIFLWKMTILVELCCIALPFLLCCCLSFSAFLEVIVHVRVYTYTVATCTCMKCFALCDLAIPAYACRAMCMCFA